MSLYALARPLLFALDAEVAHRLAITALATGVYPHAPAPDLRLAKRLFGLEFPNPVGLAPGFDKDAEVADAALGLGFGFVEVGGVTPRPQSGNPKPRLFRLAEDRAIINRFGFNSDGHDAVHRRLAARKRSGIVGVNLGANKDSADRAADYVAGVARFSDVADFLTINVSSPNTPGLRDLQERSAIADLLARAIGTRDRQKRRVPLLLKVAPDLDDDALAAIAEAAAVAGIEGIVATNTTLARDGLTSPLARESGGVSGRPLFRRSTAVLRRLRQLVGGDMVLIGVGGVDSVGAAAEKFAAGADLIQLYSGMVYEGPELVQRIVKGLAARLDHAG